MSKGHASRLRSIVTLVRIYPTTNRKEMKVNMNIRERIGNIEKVIDELTAWYEETPLDDEDSSTIDMAIDVVVKLRDSLLPFVNKS